jgi:hypothetical protein
MLTSPGAIPPEFAVAVTATIAAGTEVFVGDPLTVVAIVRSVRYSVLTPIHFTGGQLSGTYRDVVLVRAYLCCAAVWPIKQGVWANVLTSPTKLDYLGYSEDSLMRAELTLSPMVCLRL